ncbi:MAG: asparagine synthase-related protein [Gammaproteobacteria bacterium]
MSDQTNEIRVDLCGQLHNLDELKRHLNPVPTIPDELESTCVLRAGWLRWGEALAGHLVGDFALAIEDPARRVTYLARNALGVKPLYYRLDCEPTSDRSGLCYGFSIPELQQRCPKPATKDRDWAAAYLLSLTSSPTETAFVEIKKLAPGHWLRRDAQGRVTVRRFHEWRDDPPPATRRDPRWVEAYREQLREAVRCRMDADAPMGAESSGGLDSSSIVAFLADLLGEPAERLVTLGFATRDREPGFILKTSQARGIRHNHLITDQYEFAFDLERIHESVRVLGYPEEHPLVSAHLPLYRECALRGINVLFSGAGGDEFVTNQAVNVRWELRDRHLYPALWNVLPGNPLTRAVRMVKTLTVGQGMDQAAARANAEREFAEHILRPEVVLRLGLREKHIEYDATRPGYNSNNALLLDYHLTRFNLLRRLEGCSVMAKAQGVDYRWPLLDARLIQQYLSTPSIEKVGPKGVGRYLHRRAVSGLVPAAVAWNSSKAMGTRSEFHAFSSAYFAEVCEVLKETIEGLNPDIAELLDRERLNETIRRIRGGGRLDPRLAAALKRQTDALLALNYWYARP